MFKFLKDKLKHSVSGISKKIEEEGKEEEVSADELPKKSFFGKLKEKFSKDKEDTEKPKDKIAVEETKAQEPKTETAKEGPKTKTEDVKAPLPVSEKGEEKEDTSGIKEEKIREEDKAVEEKEKSKEEESLHPDADISKGQEKASQETVKQEVPDVIKEEKPTEKEEGPAGEKIDGKVADKKEESEKISEEKKETLKSDEKQEPNKKEEKKGFFSMLKHKVTTKKINEQQFEDMFWNLETALLENNVAMEVIEKMKESLKDDIVDVPMPRSKIEHIIEEALKRSITEVIDFEKIDIIEKIRQKKPFVICFVGINGSGKTTTIAKVAHMLKGKALSVVLAAADTFRAASIEQLQLHGDNLGIKVIKHGYGSDPAAVAFDAIKHATSKNIDVVLIDTAGRMHNNANLADEMKKIVRVAKPDMKIFVGESITGNDCVEQAKAFNEAVGIDGIVLSKADIDEKGGAALSVSFITKRPILYIGTGQEYKDIREFDKRIFMESLGMA